MDQYDHIYQMTVDRIGDLRRQAQRDALARMALAGQASPSAAGRIARRGLAKLGGMLAATGTALQSWAAGAEVECRSASAGWAAEARRQ